MAARLWQSNGRVRTFLGTIGNVVAGIRIISRCGEAEIVISPIATSSSPGVFKPTECDDYIHVLMEGTQ